MARLISQIKGGYYAAAPEAVAAVLERLRPPTSGECTILDPCGGEGHALLQLAQGLNANNTAFNYPHGRDRSPNVAMRDGNWKLLVNADASRVELYDLSADAGENVNVNESPALRAVVS